MNRTVPALPVMTHWQWLLAVGVCRAGTIAGRDLRTWVSEQGFKLSGPAFYQRMAALEDKGWVESRDRDKDIDGETVNERTYHLTKEGLDEVVRTAKFYLPDLELPQRG